MMADEDTKPELPMHLILGASECSRIKTQIKPKSGKPVNRKIEGDSVWRVIDQILGFYLLSCMAFSFLIRSRSRE